MMFLVKVFISKNNRKCVALCYGDAFVSFDRSIIMRILDLKPSEFDALEVGEYKIK